MSVGTDLRWLGVNNNGGGGHQKRQELSKGGDDGPWPPEKCWRVDQNRDCDHHWKWWASNNDGAEPKQPKLIVGRKTETQLWLAVVW